MSVISTYSGDPESTPKDAIRFLIGDKGPTFKFTDQEIVFLLNRSANFWMAAADLASQLEVSAGAGGGVSSKTVGRLSISYSQAEYKELAATFRSRGRGHQLPWAEGISQKFSFRQFDHWGLKGPAPRDDQGVSHVVTEETES